MKTLWLDIRHGWRSLTREPGFAVLALFTLTAGIGANTAIFTLLDAALLRPLPYPDPGRLVRIWGEHLPSSTIRSGCADPRTRTPAGYRAHRLLRAGETGNPARTRVID